MLPGEPIQRVSVADPPEARVVLGCIDFRIPSEYVVVRPLQLVMTALEALFQKQIGVAR